MRIPARSITLSYFGFKSFAAILSTELSLGFWAVGLTLAGLAAINLSAIFFGKFIFFYLPILVKVLWIEVLIRLQLDFLNFFMEVMAV